MESKKSAHRLLVPALAGLSGVLLSLLGGLGYYSYTQHERVLMLLEERNFFLLEVASSTDKRVLEAESASSTIAALTLERDDLMSKLSQEEAKNDAFERQINKISGTVGRLDKLSKTDEELLQKYSKVYFLNENYIPSKLKTIDSDYLAPGRKEQYFHGDALPYLEDMLADAKKDGVNLTVVSAYRSFETQADLKGAYLQSYGSGANTFSADQGYSEHQLGTTLDFSTPDLGGSLGGFGDTKAYAWLKDNAHKYGFTLSYPEGNAYYVYEPWHWRFVGEDLASDLKRDDANFYDWDQRKIDEYLIKIFD
jgi:LAS superfamily LD-carboxypeptidase LdcB